METEKVIILLGSDIEPRMEYLIRAQEILANKLGKVVNSSSVYESEPWGFISDTKFLNKVLIIETKNTPEETLKICQQTEKLLGRKRNGKKGYTSRTIDIDILYYGSKTVNSRKLKIPHPAIIYRRFTLEPLAEVVPDFIHPILNINQKSLLSSCRDESSVIIKKNKDAL